MSEKGIHSSDEMEKLLRETKDTQAWHFVNQEMSQKDKEKY